MLYFCKKNNILAPVFLFVVAITIALIGGCQSSSTTNPVQPETVLKNFLDSLIEMDTQKAASFVVDRRFSNKEEQLEFYEEDLQQTKYLSYQVEDIKKSGDEKVYIDAALICEEFGKTKDSNHTFRLILVDRQWKVAFPSDETIEHLFQGGGEGTITFGEPEMNNQKSLNTSDKE